MLMDRPTLLGALGGIAATLAVVALILGLIGDAGVLTGIQAMGSVAIAFSAFVAYRLFRANVARHIHEDKRAESKVFLDESIALLNRAYETFTRHGDNPPRNDRLLWFSTARMIVRFQNIRNKITETDHLAIADENEEYFRLNFSALLRECKNEFTVEYFMPKGMPYDGDVVDRKTIAVVFDFARWREDMTDPLDQVDDKELFAGGAVPIDFLGVENYLCHFQKYWEEIQERKKKYHQEET